MGVINVNFLNKKYEISEYVPIWVPILQEFEEYKEILLNKLVHQIKNQSYSGNAQEDFVYWSQPISEIAKAIIKSASKYEIYDLTEYELVDDNPGVSNLHLVCGETIKKMVSALSEAINDTIAGYNSAYSDAASQIRGSGVSIWTSSLGSALWYSFLEGNVIKKQAKQADRQFSQALEDIAMERLKW